MSDKYEIKDLKCLNATHRRAHKNGEPVSTFTLIEDIQKLQAENAELKKQSQWISVEDELPEVNQRVLTFRPDILDIDRFRFCRFGRKGFASVYKVTHWMPLPTPPEGE